MFFGTFVRFYLDLWHRRLLSHYNHCEFIVDGSHPFYRRYTREYSRKRSLVKNYWIGAGVLSLIFPFLAVFAVLFIATAFASFCLLDETD